MIQEPKVGTMYGNYQLLGVRTRACGDMYGLFYLSHNEGTPFATWFIGNNGSCPITKKFDGTGFCIGHYHKDVLSAAKDLEERGNR